MQNGYFHETGKFAPETAIGTGAAEPLVDEFEAAEATPSVDESTAGQGKNKPRQAEASDIKPSGEKVADDASDLTSTGEEAEVRDGENDNVGGDEDVNKLAAEARPAAPQKTRKQRREEADAEATPPA